AADARILLMDEPTSSLQRGEVDRLFALIRRLAARGLAVVYISHFLEEVREIADRYTVLRDGRSVDAGRLAGTSADHLIAQMVGARRGGSARGSGTWARIGRGRAWPCRSPWPTTSRRRGCPPVHRAGAGSTSADSARSPEHGSRRSASGPPTRSSRCAPSRAG